MIFGGVNGEAVASRYPQKIEDYSFSKLPLSVDPKETHCSFEVTGVISYDYRGLRLYRSIRCRKTFSCKLSDIKKMHFSPLLFCPVTTWNLVAQKQSIKAVTAFIRKGNHDPFGLNEIKAWMKCLFLISQGTFLRPPPSLLIKYPSEYRETFLSMTCPQLLYQFLS